MKSKSAAFALIFSVCLFMNTLLGQVGSTSELQDKDSFSNIVEVEAQSQFHRNVIKAAMKLHKDGKLKRSKVLRLRICMLSPAFRNAAEELAITQMVFSGAESVPMDENGIVERANIDWDKLLEFLEKLIPIILQIISIFG